MSVQYGAKVCNDGKCDYGFVTKYSMKLIQKTESHLFHLL